MSFSIAERLSHLPFYYRVVRRRGQLDALWDEPWHADLLTAFLQKAKILCNVSEQQLATIHSDDLTQIFDQLTIPVGHRVIIRKYVSIPSIAVANIWTGLQMIAVLMVTSWRLTRFMLSSKLLVGGSIGFGVAFALSARRAQLSMLARSATVALASAANPQSSTTESPRCPSPTAPDSFTRVDHDDLDE
jgi:hypothetical protein